MTEPLSQTAEYSAWSAAEKIALVGTNGIGKTTLLKSILGLIGAVFRQL